MYTQGVMAGSAQTGAILSGLSFQSSFQRAQSSEKEASFENFLDSSGKRTDNNRLGTNQTDGHANRTGNKEQTLERAKQLFSGKKAESGAKYASTDKRQAQGVTENPEEAAEAVTMLLSQVKQYLCEKFDISEETLTSKMDELCLDDSALFTQDGLQKLFLNLNQNCSQEDLLTNETLFDGFAELMQAVTQITEQSGIPVEQLRSTLELLQEEISSLKTSDMDAMSELGESSMDAGKTTSEESMEAGTDASTETSQVTVSEGNQGAGQDAKTDEKDESFSHLVAAKKTGRGKEVSSQEDANLRNTFVDAMSEAVKGNSAQTIEAAAQVREIANQILTQIKLVIRPEQTNMELQLNPEHLGRVHLSITEKEGMMTAQFTTESQMAKDAIESRMPALIESLNQQGIKVEAMEVTVSEFSFDRGRDAKQSGEEQSGRQKRQHGLLVEETQDTESFAGQIYTMAEGSIDYSA